MSHSIVSQVFDHSCRLYLSFVPSSNAHHEKVNPKDHDKLLFVKSSESRQAPPTLAPARRAGHKASIPIVGEFRDTSSSPFNYMSEDSLLWVPRTEHNETEGNTMPLSCNLCKGNILRYCNNTIYTNAGLQCEESNVIVSVLLVGGVSADPCRVSMTTSRAWTRKVRNHFQAPPRKIRRIKKLVEPGLAKTA